VRGSKGGQSDAEKRYVALINALNRRMNGPSEGFIWDSMCITPGFGNEEKIICAAMYQRPDDASDLEYQFFRTPGGGGVEPLALATAIFTLDLLVPDLAQAMAEHDAQLVASGGFMEGSLEGPGSDEYRMAIIEKLKTGMPVDDGVQLPVAFVWLSTSPNLRRHLHFYWFAGVPAVPMWTFFRTGVVGGVIGL